MFKWTSVLHKSHGSNTSHLNVVVREEILPRVFLQTPENYHLSLTVAKIRRLKKFHRSKIGQFLKTLTVKLSVFKNKKGFPPRDFDKSLQIVGCTATERHRMKKLKFHRL